MRVALRSLLVCVLGCVLGGSSLTACAWAGEASPEAPLVGGPTVVPGGESLLGGEQQQLAEEARRDSPEAVAMREASQTEFEGLDSEQAVKVDREAFQHVVEDPAGGPPQLPEGQRIVSYPTARTAQLELPDHKSGVLESLSPIAIETSPTTSVPIDLTLSEEAGQFRPARGLVAVGIPKRLGDGVSLSDQGVSLTPVDGQGQALGGSEGSLVGASVLYANTLADTDTLVKPTTDGFDLDALLRSVQSPEQLYFRVGLPAGAQLVSDSQGGAEVTLEGQTITSVLPPAAADATGSPVPVSMRVTGDVLVVSVDHRSGSYQYPVAVDPSIIDQQLQKEGIKRSNWEFYTEPAEGAKLTDAHGVCKGPGEQYLETCAGGEYKPPEGAAWIYQTRGNSKIFEFKGETEAENTSAKIESLIELEDKGSREEWMQLSTELKEPKYSKRPLSRPGNEPEPLCPKGKSTCSSAYGGEKNAVRFQQSTTGSGSKFFDYMYTGEVSISEPEEHATTKYNTTSSELEGEVINVKGEKEKIKRKNVLAGGGWLSEHGGAVGLISEDKGIGVSATQLEFESAPGKWEQLTKHNYLTEEDLCKGYQCEPKDEEFWVLSPKLPNGEDKIRYRAEDGMGSSTESPESEGVATVKVDTAKPHRFRIVGLPYGNELSEREYRLTAEATDGEGSTVASSGIESIALYIDGGLIGVNGVEGREGFCSAEKGECTASASWTINGADLGAGKHQIYIVARDRAGNEERFYDPISIRHSTPVSLGPGSVDLESGDYSLGATDVSMGSGLTVGRNYSSRALTEGSEGPLGPQWGLSVGTVESLVELVDHSMLLTDSSGRQTIFAKTETNTYESPTGDSNLKLTVEENKTTKKQEAFYLEDAADHSKTKFTLPEGGTKVWAPTIQEGALEKTDTVSYKYETVKQGTETVTRPKEALAPVPAHVSCSPMKEGCRALKFEYATATTAKGQNESGWGEFVGRLTQVRLDAYNPVSKKMEEPPVAEYRYDSLGRLRAEWDPRISPALKTKYGYDEEGHVTALTPPGQESWVFTYGASAADTGRGRVVKVYRAPASTPLWTGELPADIEAPKVTGTAAVGVRLAVSNGSWSGAPLTYGYQWERCSTSTSECSPIAGATNPNYTPSSGDLFYYIRVAVAASNGGGSVTLRTGRMWVDVLSSEFSLPSRSHVEGVTSGPDGNLWFTYSGTSKIGKMTIAGTVIGEYSLPAGSDPSEIVSGPDGNLWFTEWSASKIGKITTSGTITEYSLPSSSKPLGIAPGPDGDIWFTDSGTAKIGKITTSGTITEYSLPGGSYPDGIVSGPDGNLWFVETDSKKIGKITTSGTITEYAVAGGSEPTTIASGPDGNLWFTDRGTAKIGRITTSGTITEYALPGTSKPIGIIAGTDGNLWFADEGTGKIGRITTEGTVSEYTLPSGSEPLFVASGPNKNLWFSESGTNKIGTINISGPVVESGFGGSEPGGIVSGPENELWFTASGKIDELTTSYVLHEYAASPSGKGIAYGPDGNIWFTAASSKIDKMTLSGTVTGEYSLPSGSNPKAIVVGPDGNLWFTDSGTSKIGKITTSGTVTEYALPSASNPKAIVVGPDGNLWFTDSGTSKIGKITTSGTIAEYALSPSTLEGIAAGPDGNLWFTSPFTSKIGKITTSGTVTEYAVPSGSPTGITAGPDGNLWFAVQGSKSWVGKITTWGEITEYAVPSSSNPYGITVGPDSDLWFTDGSTNEIGTLTPPLYTGEARGPAPGWTVEYGVPLSGGGTPVNMTAAEVEKGWGQKDVPVEATAIIPPDSPQGWPASSYTRATTYYLDEQGRLVNVETPSNGKYGSVSMTEYNEENDATRTLTPDNRATALEAGEKSLEVATLLSTFNTYKNECSRESEFNEERESTEFGTRLCETEGPEHMVKYTGTKGQEEAEARDHVRYFYDEKVPAEGPDKESFGKETFNLLTEQQNLTEILGSKGRVEEEIEPRTTITSYSGQNNLGWKLRAPTSVTTDSETGGQKLKSTTLYNEAGQVMETRTPGGESGNSAHDAKIVYYTVENEAEIASCRKHPEWAGLVCQTLPAKQPETSGIPNLPVTETTYNIWNEPEKAIETFTFTPHPTSIRTRKDEYDPAGRLTSSVTTVEGNEDKTLPKVTYEYESKQGMQDVESAVVGGKTKTIISKFNTLGQLTEYSDASEGNIAKYTYNGPEKDFQIEEVSDSSNGAKSRQTYSYNKKTMQMETLWDSAAETFTASYDTEGKLTSETYPNGMCANYTYNSVGEATHLEYIKTTNCSEKSAPVWYSETIGATVRGEPLNRTSTLATENYTYDTLGRLTEAQETPAGGECSTRLYEYEKESNRTKLTSRKPASKGECATSGGTEEKHTYDEANRMTDTGIEYEGLGNITKLPAADAEGHELKSTFYVDGAVASQTQNSVTNEYGLDPAGRVLTTSTAGKTTINHYDAAGEAVAWACEAATGTEACETGKWTRNIPGIDGTLAAVQTNGATPVLQLHDLKGDVIATAELSSSATKLLSTYNSTEFGVPNKEKTPPPFAWLGAADISESLSSGVITFGATSYVPQTGRTLQSVPVQSSGYPTPIGGGTYATFTADPWVMQGGARAEAEAPGIAAAEAREAAEAAFRAAELDPEGILTGKEAIKCAESLESEARAIAIDMANGVGEIADNDDSSETDVTFALEEGEKNDLAFAQQLRTCAAQVGKGKYVTYGHGLFATRFFQSAVCFYHITDEESYGRYLVGKTHVAELCWDNPDIGEEAWLCAKQGRKIWHFE